MSLGLRESKYSVRRQKRRRRWKVVLSLAFIVTVALVSFQFGRSLSDRALRNAHDEIETLRQDLSALKQANVGLKSAAEQARLQIAELKKRYRADVPRGERRKLLALVDEQIAEGAELARLRFLIGAASREEDCQGNPTTKRFIVRTPIYDGPHTVVTFADDALTVTASGESARNANGEVQNWFDPAKPITLRIARLGEEPETVSGTLPLQHALVHDGDEYRMNAVPGEQRGFVNVTVDRCRFP